MAKQSVQDWEMQLQEVCSRTHPIQVEGEIQSTVARLHSLKHALQRLKEDSIPELLRYFPIAAVSVLESHFKYAVLSIVNSGPVYVERGLKLLREGQKPAIDIIALTHCRSTTIGEIVAHSLPFNSVGSIEKALSELLGSDFKHLASQARDQYDVRSKRPDVPLIVHDIAMLWRNIAGTFDRRHILAHEAASNYQVTFDDAQVAIDSVNELTKAIDATLWSTIWRDQPLTQPEIRDHAEMRVQTLRASLSRLLREGRPLALRRGEQAEFRRLHIEWQRFSKGWAKFETEGQMGAIRRIVRNLAEETDLRSRVEQMNSWLRFRYVPLKPDDELAE